MRSGKVRYVDCSNYTGTRLIKALAVSEHRGLVRFASLQAYYSLIAREIEWELIPACLDERVGLIVWSPLSGGFLTGKYARGEASAEGTRRAKIPTPGLTDEAQGFAIVDALAEIAQTRGVSVAQVAINYVPRRPGVTTVLIGARTREQLADNLQAAEWKLDPSELDALDEVSAKPLPYPFWHHHAYHAERMRPRDGMGAPWK